MNTSYRLGWLTIQLTFSTVFIHLTQSSTIFFYTFMITRLSNWFTIFPLNYYYTCFTICSFYLLSKFMKFICSLQPYPNAYFSYLVLPMQRNYPCEIIPILSHKSSAYSIKWVVKIIEVFFLHSKYYKKVLCKIFHILLRCEGSNPELGSSKNTIEGLPTSAIAIDSLLCIPPDNSLLTVSFHSSKSTSNKDYSILVYIKFLFIPFRVAQNFKCSYTVNESHSKSN